MLLSASREPHSTYSALILLNENYLRGNEGHVLTVFEANSLRKVQCMTTHLGAKSAVYQQFYSFRMIRCVPVTLASLKC